MKKNLLVLAVTSAVFFASSAMADGPTAISSGNTIAPTGANNCSILGDSVKLNLSKGVHGAFNCDEARNAINVGACHESGSRSTSLTCAQIGVDSSDNPVFNDPSCAGQAAGAVITVSTASYRGFRASSTGGTVGAQSLSANCAAGVPEAQLVNFQ
ncbi:hypothetical protein [Stutzerimonas balearica]|jgi:hypothetical protein|uniref:hypothetical protein n=1 Tax=Stutzerimonas balearica TaxID=74829 RepID=UPI00190D5C2A|nr:hypothetical protein [Stutzerimonas balearica]MBK3749473.1 hypothetical protein [Stutzerimonas balearica]MBK3827668.1 hypothetical protein [Stutzerimonas balearica]MBK3857354.1 hypothetical protein [Stutzerimonas balearica]